MKDYPLKENELRVLLEDFNAVWADQRKIIELLINKTLRFWYHNHAWVTSF
jgi:hypothetical protein